MKLWKPGDPITAAGLNAMQDNARHTKKHTNKFAMCVPINNETYVNISGVWRIFNKVKETYIRQGLYGKVYITTYRPSVFNMGLSEEQLPDYQPSVVLPILPVNREINFLGGKFKHTFTKVGVHELFSWNILISNVYPVTYYYYVQVKNTDY
jgi:hypothetical protein